jgi:hypothetical protein
MRKIEPLTLASRGLRKLVAGLEEVGELIWQEDNHDADNESCN